MKADGCFISVDSTMAENPPTIVNDLDKQLDQVEADPLVTHVEVKTFQEPQRARDGTSSLTQG